LRLHGSHKGASEPCFRSDRSKERRRNKGDECSRISAEEKENPERNQTFERFAASDPPRPADGRGSISKLKKEGSCPLQEGRLNLTE